MQNLIDQKHVFDPSLFQIINPAHIMCTTVDDLVLGKSRQIVAPVKTDEIIERFQLWHEYLAVNTFTSMATLKDFTIDETLYPEIFDHAALMFLYQNIGYQVPADYSRLCAPVLARNTLWENSNMASTFDDVREMSCLAASHFTKPLLKYRINLVRLVRRSVRYSRESRMCSVHRFASDNLLSLHNGLLYHFEDVPDLFKPFSSLVQFQPLADNLNLIINNVNRSFSSFGQDLLLLMVGFIYTHLPNISDISRKFRVDSKNAKILLSSAEIILTVLKAVGFIIRSLYTPINGPEMHSQGTNLLSGIPVSIVSQGNTPAPGLATFESALALYIIASSSCLVSKQNLQFSHVVGLFIKQCYLPALQKIGNVKPIANEYVKKLAAVTQ